MDFILLNINVTLQKEAKRERPWLRRVSTTADCKDVHVLFGVGNLHSCPASAFAQTVIQGLHSCTAIFKGLKRGETREWWSWKEKADTHFVHLPLTIDLWPTL